MNQFNNRLHFYHFLQLEKILINFIKNTSIDTAAYQCYYFYIKCDI